MQGVPWLVCSDVENVNRGIAASSGQVVPVGAESECQRIRGRELPGPLSFPRRRIPKVNRAIVSRRCSSLPIGTEDRR